MENNKLESKKLEILQEQLSMHRSQDRRAAMLLQFAMILTGLLYFMFEKHLFLGDAVTWGEYFQTWHGAADFILMFIIVVMSAIFLAWVKHHAYLHFGLYGSIGLIVLTVIGFALFAEFFSSSASQDTKSRVLLSNDAAYQATIAPTSAPAPAVIGGGNAGEIAAAEQVYARCLANIGKPGYKHCNGDKAKLDSLKNTESTRMEVSKEIAIQTNIETEKLRNERQDKLKADSYNPVIVSIAKFISAIFGGAYTDHIKAAIVLVTLIVAIAFEILHHFLSHAKERAQNAVYGLELELAKYEGTAAPEKPESVIPKNDGHYQDNKGFGFIPRQPATTRHDAGTGTAYSTVEPPMFKYQQPAPQEAPQAKRQPFGFIPARPAGKTREQIEQEESVVMSHRQLEPFKSKAFPDPAQLRKADGFRQSPEQLARVMELAADDTGKTYRQELRSGSNQFRDVPLDKPEPARPVDQAHGKTGLHNPALGTAEKHFPLPIGEPEKPRVEPRVGQTEKPRVEPRVGQTEKPRVEPRARGLLEADENHVHAVSDEPAKARAAEGAEGADSLYPEWIAAVRAKECKPTVNNTRLWIQRRIAPTMTGSKTNDLKRIDAMRKGFFARAIREGLVQLNDSYTNGGKKYIWIG